MILTGIIGRKSFQFLLTHGFETSIPLQRICFVLTKADLWAQQAGHSDDAVSFLAAQNPIDIVRHIIGEKSLDTLSVFLENQAQIGFSFTSVYGFENGAVHSNIGKDDNPVDIEIEAWKPYSVAESFAWLISGEVINEAVQVINYEELSQMLKGEA